MAQAKAKNAQILTTDRGGPLRLALGGVLLAIGLGWAFAMVMSTVSAWNTLRLFRDTANGLAGVLCPLLPVFALAGGAMLCVSARRRISLRAYLLLLAMYLCLLGILTLVTSVSSRGNTLMNYIANNNKNVLGLIDNTSFSAYLTGAYNLRGFNGGQLAGGGLLGMLIAYPVYSVFNTVGGATLLIMLELVLLLVPLSAPPAGAGAGAAGSAAADRCISKRAPAAAAASRGAAHSPADGQLYHHQRAERSRTFLSGAGRCAHDAAGGRATARSHDAARLCAGGIRRIVRGAYPGGRALCAAGRRACAQNAPSARGGKTDGADGACHTACGAERHAAARAFWQLL